MKDDSWFITYFIFSTEFVNKNLGINFNLSKLPFLTHLLIIDVFSSVYNDVLFLAKIPIEEHDTLDLPN